MLIDAHKTLSTALLFCLLLNSGCTSNSDSLYAESTESIEPLEVEKETKIKKSLIDPLINKVLLKQYNCPHHYCKNFTLEVFEGKMAFLNLETSDLKPSDLKMLESNKLISRQNLEFKPETKEKLKQIIHALKLRKMKTEVIPGKSNCQNFATSYPSYQLALYKGDFVQTIDIYQGCQNLLQSHKDLIDWIKGYSPKNNSSDKKASATF